MLHLKDKDSNLICKLKESRAILDSDFLVCDLKKSPVSLPTH